jgi:iron-sulfur cluster assembly accessory protein
MLRGDEPHTPLVASETGRDEGSAVERARVERATDRGGGIARTAFREVLGVFPRAQFQHVRRKGDRLAVESRNAFLELCCQVARRQGYTGHASLTEEVEHVNLPAEERALELERPIEVRARRSQPGQASIEAGAKLVHRRKYIAANKIAADQECVIISGDGFQEIQTMINVSSAAASKISELLAEEGKAGSGLRVFVQGGGCSGFQYGLMIEESGGVGDQVYESNGVRLFVDPVSISYLKGAEVDFVDTVTGGGFTIKNPNATSTCGCGQSFSVAGEAGGGHY